MLPVFDVDGTLNSKDHLSNLMALRRFLVDQQFSHRKDNSTTRIEIKHIVRRDRY